MLKITVNLVQGGIMPTDMAEASAEQVTAAARDRHPIAASSLSRRLSPLGHPSRWAGRDTSGGVVS
jgi:hypothetical protein